MILTRSTITGCEEQTIIIACETHTCLPMFHLALLRNYQTNRSRTVNMDRFRRASQRSRIHLRRTCDHQNLKGRGGEKLEVGLVDHQVAHRCEPSEETNQSLFTLKSPGITLPTKLGPDLVTALAQHKVCGITEAEKVGHMMLDVAREHESMETAELGREVAHRTSGARKVGN